MNTDVSSTKGKRLTSFVWCRAHLPGAAYYIVATVMMIVAIFQILWAWLSKTPDAFDKWYDENVN